MATVLIEEVLMGLDHIKERLEEALVALAILADDLHPALGGNVHLALTRTLLYPLQARLAVLEQLQVDLVAQSAEEVHSL